MKIKFSLILLVVFISFSFTSDQSWILYNTFDGVEVYSKTASVDQNPNGEKAMLFKYSNTNASVVELSWRLDLYYGDNCRGCNLPSPNEYEVSITLNAGQTIAGSVSDTDITKKVFYSNESKNITPLTRFEFTNVSVNLK
ncbi:MAG: hypothetical protein JXR34_04150 [Bacteroidales bacterium]|nr:hypothetical protein [Bacteroidales bacterium]